MTRKFTVLTMVVAAAALLVTEGVFADVGDNVRSRHAGARRAIADHAGAVAALEGVGAVDGWGRMMVKDIALADGGIRRMATVHVLGLDAEADYRVMINETFQLAMITTDSQGDAKLRMDTQSDLVQGVPEGLPWVEDLVLVEVFDSSDGVALVGEFVLTSYGGNGPRDLVYFERIVLSSDDTDVRGVAKVAVDGDDIESFSTRACGLEAEAAYRIDVDGAPAGQATADVVGQAALELSSDDEDNLLPAELGSVQEFGFVEWVHVASGLTVLEGVFSGENMVGSGPIRDPQGDGEGGSMNGPGGNGGSGGPGDDRGRGANDDNGGPHGDGECDGEGSQDGGGGNGGQ